MVLVPASLLFLSLPLLATATSSSRHFPSSALHARQPHHPAPRSYSTHSYYVLELHPSSPLDPYTVASLLHEDVELVERVGELDDHYLVRVENSRALGKRDGEDVVLGSWNRKRSTGSGLREHARSVEKMVPKLRAKRDWIDNESNPLWRREEGENMTEYNFLQTSLDVQDPLLLRQWHIVNTHMPENEMNVTRAWEQGVTGTGIHVAIIDDGLDSTSEDLKDNFYAEGSYDFNDHTPLPQPRLSDDTHGTRCAGEISAVKNDVCGLGVAHTSKIAGVRILSAPISDADEAAALNYGYQTNDIYSCSWGPPDNGKEMDAPEGLILKAMVNGITNGRAGKGSIFVFAAGNGGGVDDQCNFDGYTNSIYSMTIGAVDRKGLHPYYSEMCAAVLAVAPSSGSGDHIHTTDVGERKCSDSHGGTSAAAPLAVGMMALALQVRPELTWRDAQHLAVNAVDVFNTGDPDWEKTAAGRMYNYKYGYGKINAGKLVDLARTWNLVKPQAWYESPLIETLIPSRPSPSNETAPSLLTGTFIVEEGVSVSHTVTADALQKANFERLEHVTVRVWIDHARRGDVEVELTSPAGVKSVLARTRRQDEATTGFQGWKFMSMKHWDEPAEGEWTLTVLDRVNPLKNGTLNAWSLSLWGESIDASKAVPYQLPSDDPDSDPLPPPPDSNSSVDLPPAATATKAHPKPTDHLPDDHGTAPGESNKPGLGDPVHPTEKPPLPTSTEAPSTAAPFATPSAVLDEGAFDGMSSLAANSTWVLGALAFIGLAGTGVGAFFFLRSRRRKMRGFGGGGEEGEGGGGYVGVAGEDDVAMGMLSGRRNGGGGKTKELYDAFGDGSSDESIDDDDGAALRYHETFLDDDEAEASGSGYRDDDLDDPEGARSTTAAGEGRISLPSSPTREALGEGSSSGSGSGDGSWQDVVAK